MLKHMAITKASPVLSFLSELSNDFSNCPPVSCNN